MRKYGMALTGYESWNGLEDIEDPPLLILAVNGYTTFDSFTARSSHILSLAAYLLNTSELELTLSHIAHDTFQILFFIIICR